MGISTHSLTKRLTNPANRKFVHMYISTHSLTKRLTTYYDTYFSSRDISTHSLTKRLTFESYGTIRFINIFQLTASRRG